MSVGIGLAVQTAAMAPTRVSETDRQVHRSELPVGAGIADAIVRIRGQNVMLDADLAELYGVSTRALNQAVQRNRSRFPLDFMFQLTAGEAGSLRSQSVILNVRRGAHRKYAPFAFTEQGVAMLSSVLRSPKAIAVNIEIMRAFVRLRRLLDANAGLARKLAQLERKYDGQFKTVFAAIRALMTPPLEPRKPIGFRNSARAESPPSPAFALRATAGLRRGKQVR